MLSTGLVEVLSGLTSKTTPSNSASLSSAGTELTWTNQGRNEHNVRPAIEGAFDSISAASLAVKGDSASRLFAEPGDYPYFCSLHGTATNGQTGRIIVVPADSA